MTGTAIRVLLVDDQELVRTGLRGILRAAFGFDVVGECADGGEVMAAVDAVAPDVVLMDVRMPFVDGVQATLQLKRRESSPPVLALTTFDDDQALAGMLRAGASGFVLKGVPAEDLQRAVRSGAPDALNEAARMVNRGGRICLAAFPHEPVSVDLAYIVRNNIYVFGIRGEGRSATHRAAALMGQRRFDAKLIHTHTFPLGELPTALRYARDRVEDAIKVVVKMRGD